MPHSFTHLLTHAIFSTKGRQPTLHAELKTRLLPYMGGIVREIGGCLIGINGTADHIHMLIRLPGTVCLADTMRLEKANSSRWVHETWTNRRGFARQTGYGGFSVSQFSVEAVRRYIANQEEHHRRTSFQEEFVTFLQRHGIAYDERYIWD